MNSEHFDHSELDKAAEQIRQESRGGREVRRSEEDPCQTDHRERDPGAHRRHQPETALTRQPVQIGCARRFELRAPVGAREPPDPVEYEQQDLRIGLVGQRVDEGHGSLPADGGTAGSIR